MNLLSKRLYDSACSQMAREDQTDPSNISALPIPHEHSKRLLSDNQHHMGLKKYVLILKAMNMQRLQLRAQAAAHFVHILRAKCTLHPRLAILNLHPRKLKIYTWSVAFCIIKWVALLTFCRFQAKECARRQLSTFYCIEISFLPL